MEDLCHGMGNGTTNVVNTTYSSTPLRTMEVEEEVVTEREFDANGNVIKETRTVRKLRQPAPLYPRWDYPVQPPYDSRQWWNPNQVWC